MKKVDVIKEINDTQDDYVNELINIIKETSDEGKLYKDLKEINFTSPTGTGKTIMMSKLINLLPEYFFVITTLSRGQLRTQVQISLEKHCKYNNFNVFGLNEYTATTVKQAKDYIAMLPKNKPIIWLRDEGHIATNRWQEIFNNRSEKIINFSATNKNSNGIQCNFTHTMMLRTVSQCSGTPRDALNKLLEVKEAHKEVNNYNPCALFRILDDKKLEDIINCCNELNLKYINITTEAFDMSSICDDNNKYDVIINKFKITEGIDLKRCHVIYMDSKPSNDATVVQVIGRARRNALLWRDDIDICASKNVKLLEETRKCYIYYNVPETKIEQNSDGELSYSLCDTISIEALKPNIIVDVKKGQMLNGLKIIELEKRTGKYKIIKDDKLGFNIVDKLDKYYESISQKSQKLMIDISNMNLNVKRIYFKSSIIDYFDILNKNRFYIEDRNKLKYLYFEKYMDDNNYYFDKLECRKKYFIGDSEKMIDYDLSIEMDSYIESVMNKYNIDLHYLYYEFKVLRKCFDFYDYHIRHETIDNRFKNHIVTNNCKLFDTTLYTKCINKELLQYIDSIDINDTYNIPNFNTIPDYIKIVNINKYIYSKHPFKIELERNKNISNYEDLVNKIKKSKKTFYKLPIEYWKYIIESITSLDELDNFDIEILTLSELNKKFNLKISQNKMNILLNDIPSNKKIKDDKNILISKRNNKGFYERIYNFRQYYFSLQDLSINYNEFIKTINDREIAIIGPDIMKFVDGKYIEDKAVTSKITKYCKFNTFISSKYKNILLDIKDQLYSGENKFDFNTKCNSCLGYCSEYYAKYLLFGENFPKRFINEALNEAKTNEISEVVIVRACMLLYKDEMSKCYGKKVGSLIPSISVEQLIKENYKEFVETVKFLGNRIANFIQNKIHIKEDLAKGNLLYDPNLSVNHISALCDFINKDTIIDVKCTSNIEMKHIKQVLSYYYLSTKRSDLNIKYLYVYDAVKDKFAFIDLTQK